MKYIIAIIVVGISIYLFKKASGTLKINLINISGFAFYSLMIFEFIGVILVYWGFRDQYLIAKITNDNTITTTYWVMAYTMIVLPITIIITNRYIFKIHDVNKIYVNNIKEETILEDKKTRDRIFVLVILALIVCFIATIYVFYCIGYIPLLKYFDGNFDFSTARISSGRNFAGNQYIKNIIMLGITPILSHIAYIYMRLTKEKKWTILFIISFIMNIFIKTYDFSKAPIIYYICYFVIIEVMLGKTFRFKKLLPYMVTTICLIVIFYTVIMGYEGSFISLSNGPMARVLITQAGTLFLHFDTFPNKVDYLNGHSFPKIAKILLGEGEYGVRSGRVLMEFHNEEAVKNGTAGVMSSAFIGEAYANFGIIGVIVMPIIVGLIFSAIFCIYLKSKKSPLNIILYLECFIIFTGALQGGIVEFFYNVQFYITLIVIFGIKILSNEKVNKKIKDIFQKRKDEKILNTK